MASRETGRAIMLRARALVGAPFAAQGRGQAGWDCLGVVVHAVGAVRALPDELIGWRPALKGTGLDDALERMGRSGAVRVCLCDVEAGDILLAVPAEGQLHLGVASDRGVIEAHAGLGRVVERPWRSDDGWLGAWRLDRGEA